MTDAESAFFLAADGGGPGLTGRTIMNDDAFRRNLLARTAAKYNNNQEEKIVETTVLVSRPGRPEQVSPGDYCAVQGASERNN